jgi:hypothetical protein
VDDARTLVNTVASFDQRIDPVIVEFGPTADHVDDVDIGGVKMETSAALAPELLCTARTSCTRTLPLVAALTPVSQ